MIGCYVRVSTQEQANEGYSVSEQTDRLRKYADAMGWDVFKVYTDGGFSGANTERPALQQMIKDIKAGIINRVLVYKLDRLSRSQKDTLYLIEDVFLANGCDFVSMCENFDTSTPFGRAMIGILAVFSQLEREQIKERLAMGIEARAKEGKFNGNNLCAVGYEYIDGQLVVNEFEAMQIKMIYELYLQGYSATRIAKMMNEKGLTHKYGEWNRRTLQRALSRKTYLGLIEHKGQVYQGQHQPIISQELFDAVQRKIEENQKPFAYSKTGKNYNSNLAGLLVCARCGATYTKRTHSSNRKDGKPYYYYICNSKQKRDPKSVRDPNCKNKTWKIETLDNLVFDEVKKLAFDPNYLASHKLNKKKDDRPKALDKQIASLESQLSKLMELYSVDGISLDQLQKKIAEINTKKLKLEQEKTKILLEEKDEMTKEDVLKLIKSFDSVLESGSMPEIRAILQALIDKIEIDGDDVTIYWKFT